LYKFPQFKSIPPQHIRGKNYPVSKQFYWQLAVMPTQAKLTTILFDIQLPHTNHIQAWFSRLSVTNYCLCWLILDRRAGIFNEDIAKKQQWHLQ